MVGQNLQVKKGRVIKNKMKDKGEKVCLFKGHISQRKKRKISFAPFANYIYNYLKQALMPSLKMKKLNRKTNPGLPSTYLQQLIYWKSREQLLHVSLSTVS